MIAAVIVAGAVALAAWVLSLIFHEYSWVDRIWSVVPVVYLAIFAGSAGFTDPRADLMLVLGLLWGVRLTLNYARKGGYRPGGEDYRWAVLRGRMTRAQFAMFNLGFICVFQNLVLLAITLPAYAAATHWRPLGVPDVVLAVIFLVLLVGETVADQQQWRFQRAKAATVGRGEQPSPRFLQSGLFRFARHPNYFCELGQWWVMFGLGLVAAGVAGLPMIIGPVLLTAVFVGSTIFTEQISLGRYPEYAEYRRRTSAIIPWRPAPRTPVPAP